MSKKITYLVSVCLMLASAGSASAAISITTEDGRGADTYLSNDSQSGIGTNGPDTTHGAEVRMRAFRQLADTRSKTGYIRFDLAGIGGDMSGATLTFDATYLKGSAKTVQVYGLIDGDGDFWDESTITYNTAVGVIPNPPTTLGNCVLDTAKVTLLGTITTPAAGDPYPVRFSSNPTDLPLADFLNADGNGLVTFLFIGTDNEGEIASKEHETFNPPTLNLPNAAMGPRTSAVYLNPANEADYVSRDVVLSWTPGATAATHNVYFAIDFDAVDTASPSALVAEGQDANTYDPIAPLAYGQTYYWRIDEVNGAPDFTIHEGGVWSFTVEPLAYPLVNVTATASIPSDADKGPEKTVDGSGLDADGQHSTDETDMWMGTAAEGEPVWIQYDFDRVYKLHDARVWNYNMEYEMWLGLGLEDVTIEYATDANDWMTLGDFQLPQAPGLTTYTGTTVSFGGIAAQSVRINIHSNRSTQQPLRFGLGEIQFSYIPVNAREPRPESGATEVDPEVVLSWRAGREAVSHQVYFGTDSNTVADGTALFDTVATNTYDLGTLDLGTTYYWKIVEVNDAETPISWASDIWNFSTPTYLLIDGFEDYTDDPGEEIFMTWEDGYNDNSNGSQVGHDDPPYAEETIVYSGAQSMPLRYGQNGATTSEAKMTLPAEDWTAGGATTLVLQFHGKLGNAAGQLYVKVNNGAPINYPGGTAALAAPLWKPWNIDLATLGNIAKSVTTLTIGVTGSGTGMLYIDDIRLYKTAPPLPEPAVDPGTANLVALYAMEDNVNDGSGNGRNGTAQVGSSFGTGPTGYGKAIVLDGASGYVDLPIGPVVQSLGSATVATWVNWTSTDGLGRIFDFGTGTTANMWMAPNAYGGLVFAITSNGIAGESRVVAPAALPSGWHHVAVTIDGATSVMWMYLDGALADSETTTTLPSAIGNTTQNWIGRSQYEADPYFKGSVDDFRIYNRALSVGEVRYLVGDR